MRPLTIAACLALASAAFATAAQDAQTPATPAAAPARAAPAAAPAAASPGSVPGNAKRGLELTYTCHGCHGVVGYRNAYPNYRVPMIVGQSKLYLINALTDYKNGARKHPTMQAQALSFSQQDIADIAAYLSNEK
ncbi:c-type cytochrome [Lysobacter korlensis]|uniref:C-type cytochrome n=1 Tax=Lysobacter korlensis TaxID=553636 RepID=A0ABV6RL83_9GAMM